MSPIEARVFLVEDNKTARSSVKRWLAYEGHKVVLEAGDFETALEGVKQVKELGVNVAVLDGNLSEQDTSCADGREIATALRKVAPDIKVVSYSGSDNADYGDVKINKEDSDVFEKLPRAITEL